MHVLEELCPCRLVLAGQLPQHQLVMLQPVGHRREVRVGGLLHAAEPGQQLLDQPSLRVVRALQDAELAADTLVQQRAERVVERLRQRLGRVHVARRGAVDRPLDVEHQRVHVLLVPLRLPRCRL